jgi:Short C-terminal domain/Phospholipase_D-nuclease N-terminal
MDDNFGLWEVLVSTFWFMLLFAWIWLLIAILSDIFRDPELSGGSKALWTLFLIFLPWLGALIYLISRGKSMNERNVRAAKERDEQMRAYVQDAAGTTSTADELRKLSELRDSGAITPEDYEKAKAKALG